MNKSEASKVDKKTVEESLLFDPADATPFKKGLFDGESKVDPEIDLLAVKAMNREGEDDDLDIKHGMMILQSHRKELAELEDLDEAKVSNKKVAVIMIILFFFVAFILIVFMFSRLLGDSSGISENNPGTVLHSHP